MRRTLKTIPVALLLLAGATTAGHAAAEGWPARTREAPTTRDVKSGSCTGLTEVDFKTDNRIESSTSSFDFVNVPGANISFTQGTAGCVIVIFSAESYAPANRSLQLRAVLDSASFGGAPGAVQFSGDDDEDFDGRWARSHAFTFVFPSVSAGAHTVRMQYKPCTAPDCGFGPVFLGKRTTIVQHR